MIPNFFLDLLATAINNLVASLPPWAINLGGDCVASGCGGTDGSAFYTAMQLAAKYDRFMPVKDALLPILGISALLITGFVIIKVVKFIISCIPSISAGG